MTARQKPSSVVSFSEAVVGRRLKSYRARLERALVSNKKAIGRLYDTGLLFTRAGTSAGRDLLLAHQHLLRVVTLLDRLEDQGDVPAPRKQSEVDEIFSELDLLLERTGELTDRTGEALDSLRRE